MHPDSRNRISISPNTSGLVRESNAQCAAWTCPTPTPLARCPGERRPPTPDKASAQLLVPALSVQPLTPPCAPRLASCGSVGPSSTCHKSTRCHPVPRVTRPGTHVRPYGRRRPSTCLQTTTVLVNTPPLARPLLLIPHALKPTHTCVCKSNSRFRPPAPHPIPLQTPCHCLPTRTTPCPAPAPACPAPRGCRARAAPPRRPAPGRGRPGPDAPPARRSAPGGG